MKKENSNQNVYRPMALTLKAVILKDDKVLLLKRSKKEEFNKGKWDLPGGHIEAGETVNESLKREVKKETGLVVAVDSIINIVEFEKEHKAFRQEKRGLRFLVNYLSGEVKLNENEHSEFQWLTLTEAIEKLDVKDHFENEKRETLLKAKECLEQKEALNGWRRALADFENYKKRQLTNNEEFRKFANEDLILEILPVLDNFQAAMEHIPQEQKNEGWVTGIMFIQKQLLDILATKGLEKIPVKIGDEIDENIHEIVRGKAGDGKLKVKKILSQGYKIADRVIRPARVEV